MPAARARGSSKQPAGARSREPARPDQAGALLVVGALVLVGEPEVGAPDVGAGEVGSSRPEVGAPEVGVPDDVPGSVGWVGDGDVDGGSEVGG